MSLKDANRYTKGGREKNEFKQINFGECVSKSKYSIAFKTVYYGNSKCGITSYMMSVID